MLGRNALRGRRITILLAAASASLLLAQTIRADTTIQVQSGANTLGAAIGPGVPTDDQLARLDTPDTTGLIFAPVDVGSFGTLTPVPPGGPGTLIVNLPPDDGENGYYKVTFNLPAGGPYYQIQGAANVDDVGRVFLNGNALTPDLGSGVTETGNFFFSTNDASFFQPGQNILLVSDANIGSGPSGAAFFATITTSDQPFSTKAAWLGNDGNWSDPSQWSTNPTYPTAGSPAGATYDVTIPSGAVNLDVSATVDSLTISGGTLGGTGTLTFQANVHYTHATLAVSSGPQTISAPVTFNSDTLLEIDPVSSLSFADGISGNSGLTLTGGGALTLDASATANRSISANQGALTINGPITSPTAITINGGSVTIDSLDDLPGALTFQSGSLNINGDLHIGAGHALPSLTLNTGDELSTAGGILTLESGVANLAGGTLTVAKLANTTGSLNFTAGTLNITNSLGGSATLTAGAPLGPTLNIHPGMTMNLGDTLNLASDGALTISGGTLSTHQLINNSSSPISFSSGNLTVDSLTLDAFGPSRPLGNSLTVPANSSVAVNQTLNVGQNAGASMNVQGIVTVGLANLAATAGSSATVSVTGYLGVAGNLSIGGTWDPIAAAGSPGGSAAVTVSNGGQISVAGTTFLYPSSSITLNGGTLFTGFIDDHGGTISFSSNPSTQLYVQGDLALGAGHALHDPVDIVTNSTLNIYGNATFDPGADVTLDGGSADFGALIDNGGKLHVISGVLGIDNLVLATNSAVGPTLNVQNLSVIVAQTTTLSPGASLTITDTGSFSTGSLVNNSGASIPFTTGSLTIYNGLTIDTFAPDRPLGNSVAVHGNTLSVGLLQVGETDSGTLVVDSGGTINAGDVGVGSDTGSVGSVHIGGTATVESDATWNSAETYLGYEPLDNDGPLVPGGTGSVYIGTGTTVSVLDVFVRRGSSLTIEGGTVSTSTVSLGADSDTDPGSANFTMTGGFFGTLGVTVAPGCNCSITDAASFEINVFINSGTTVIGGSQDWIGPASYVNLAGTTTFTNDSGANNPSMLLFADGGSVIFQSTQHLAALNLSGSAQVTMPAATPRQVIVTNSLSFAQTTNGPWQGTLDLADNDMIVHNGVLADITSQFVQGFNNGHWNGAGGIISSAAAATNNTTLAIELNDDGTNTQTPLMTTFDNEPVGDTDVLIKYTFYGDSNLDGVVNATDYTALDNGFNTQTGPTPLTGWRNGDFNYDGVINGDDYTLIDNAFNSQGSVSFAATSAGPAEMIATNTDQIATPAVPEPTISLVGLSAIAMLQRRSRRVSPRR